MRCDDADTCVLCGDNCGYGQYFVNGQSVCSAECSEKLLDRLAAEDRGDAAVEEQWFREHGGEAA